MRNDDTAAPPSDGLVGELGSDDCVRDNVDQALTLIRKHQGTATEQQTEQALIVYVVGKQQQLRRAAAEIERLKAERQKYVDAHASVKGGLVEWRDRAEQAERQCDALRVALEELTEVAHVVCRAESGPSDLVAEIEWLRCALDAGEGDG